MAGTCGRRSVSSHGTYAPLATVQQQYCCYKAPTSVVVLLGTNFHSLGVVLSVLYVVQTSKLERLVGLSFLSAALKVTRFSRVTPTSRPNASVGEHLVHVEA